ncbi:hypothetical protein Avbf_02328, partial [Armadillidium vulgare]
LISLIKKMGVTLTLLKINPSTYQNLSCQKRKCVTQENVGILMKLEDALQLIPLLRPRPLRTILQSLPMLDLEMPWQHTLVPSGDLSHKKQLIINSH